MGNVLYLWARNSLGDYLSAQVPDHVISDRKILSISIIKNYKNLALLAESHWEEELKNNTQLRNYLFSTKNSFTSIYVISFYSRKHLNLKFPYMKALSLLPNGGFLRLPSISVLNIDTIYKNTNITLLQKLNYIYTERYSCHDNSLTDSLTDFSWELEQLYYENNDKFYSTWQLRIAPRLLTISNCYRAFITNSINIPKRLKPVAKELSTIINAIKDIEANIKTLFTLMENRKKLYGGVCTVIENTDHRIEIVRSHILVIRESMKKIRN